MTPFGERLRKMRSLRSVTQKEMAAAIGVSAAYLSALEHGHRGRPGWDLLQRIILYFNIIWDEAEDLQRLAMLSHPRVVIDTAGLAPEATELANLLAETIQGMDRQTLRRLIGEVRGERNPSRRS